MAVMKKQQGFTLIELVIVIVILGILAVTAAPKFLNLAGDAKAGTLNAVKASLQSANAEIYSKAILQNKQTGATATLSNPAVNIVYGYADATTTEINKLLDAPDFTVYDAVAATINGVVIATATDVLIRPNSSAAITANATTGCALVYRKAASAGAKPTYFVLDNGC
jgi:MSHA pilin protein MshA